MHLTIVAIVALFAAFANAATIMLPPSVTSGKRSNVAAVLPGDPIITAGLGSGAATAVAIYSKVILARFALSWFPQLVTQFPILQPVFTVTEPYLRVFRSVIPPIGGFDISALPAIFCLDILGQTAVAVGADFPAHMKKGISKVIRGKPIKLATEGKSSRNNFQMNGWGPK